MSERPSPPQHVNVFFRLAVGAGGAFVVTILAFTATLFGDSRSPAAAMLQRNVGGIFVFEVGALIVLGIAAMVVDRRESLRHLAAKQPAGDENPAPDRPVMAPPVMPSHTGAATDQDPTHAGG